MPFRGLTMLKSRKLVIKGGLCYRFAMVKNIFSENIFDVNIFDNNIFGKNIFFLPFLHLTSLQTIPTSSQLLISDF